MILGIQEAYWVWQAQHRLPISLDREYLKGSLKAYNFLFCLEDCFENTHKALLGVPSKPEAFLLSMVPHSGRPVRRINHSAIYRSRVPRKTCFFVKDFVIHPGSSLGILGEYSMCVSSTIDTRPVPPHSRVPCAITGMLQEE